MVAPAHSVLITVASVVLDRPDRTGQFIASDMAGGWAYLVTDEQGDKRFRGQGTGEGGVHLCLRYALLSALDCVPDARRLIVCVESPQAHRQIVALATADAQVVAGIAGRPFAVTTRPDRPALFHAKAAAERAAGNLLRTREQTAAAETAPAPDPEVPDPEVPDPEVPDPEVPADDPPPPPAPEPAAPDDPVAATAAPANSATVLDSWRERWGASLRARIPARQRPAGARAPADPARDRTTSGRILTHWLQEFDRSVETVRADLDTLTR